MPSHSSTKNVQNPTKPPSPPLRAITTQMGSPYSSTNPVMRFLQLKRYQYEVTFSLYMLTPVEKIIFNSFVFIALSLLVIAVSFYLPHHIAIVASRAWWYYAGDEGRAAAGMDGLAGAGAVKGGL